MFDSKKESVIPRSLLIQRVIDVLRVLEKGESVSMGNYSFVLSNNLELNFCLKEPNSTFTVTSPFNPLLSDFFNLVRKMNEKEIYDLLSKLDSKPISCYCLECGLPLYGEITNQNKCPFCGSNPLSGRSLDEDEK